MDGRNPAPPKKPYADSPENTNKRRSFNHGFNLVQAEACTSTCTVPLGEASREQCISHRGNGQIASFASGLTCLAILAHPSIGTDLPCLTP